MKIEKKTFFKALPPKKNNKKTTTTKNPKHTQKTHQKTKQNNCRVSVIF